MRNALRILGLCFLFACGHKQEENRLPVHAPKVVEAKGYVVPRDSMAAPKVIPVDESKLKKIPVGKPKVVPTNTNVHPAGKGKVVWVDEAKLRVITPGKGGFTLPKMVRTFAKPVLAGIPEIVAAKDRGIKDKNPHSFSFFNKQQGLKQSVIRCIEEDNLGNLWFGTHGGGLTKYDGRNFTHYTQNEGLSNNIIFDILEDSKENIWCCTYGGGVVKYDGVSYTTFKQKDGLVSDQINCAVEDNSGNIWFGADDNGVCKYDGVLFTHYTDKEGLSSNEILCAIKDKHGKLWFGTGGGGVTQFDGTKFIHFTEKDGLCNNVVQSILEDNNGNIWFGTDGAGVSKYDGNAFIQYTTEDGLSNNSILSIQEDKCGNIWFGTDGGGINKYDGKFFYQFSEKEGLSHNEVLSIIEDKNGNIWIGTSAGGVNKYDGLRFTHFTKEEGLNSNVVFSMLEDKTGNIWLANRDGGVSKYDGKNFIHYTEKDGLSNNVIQSIIEDKQGNFWFGSSGGLCKFDGKFFTSMTCNEGLCNDVVVSILEDKCGNLWIGTDGGGVSKFDGKSFTNYSTKEGLSNNNVWSLLEDKLGNIWFGTYGGGLTKYDGKKFTHFTESQGLGSKFVYCMLEDSYGNLWIGTDGGGVYKYNGTNFTSFTKKDGLISDAVLSIVEDRRRNIWVGSRLGLSRLNFDQTPVLSQFRNKAKNKTFGLSIRNYTYEDGFLGIGCIRNSLMETIDGSLWIGANDRLTVYHAPKLDFEDTLAPNMQVLSVFLFNESIPWSKLIKPNDSIVVLSNGLQVKDFSFDEVSPWYNLPKNLKLKYNNNYINFNFTGITLNQSQKVKYTYKLEGVDNVWSPLSERTDASYGNLPPGTFVFKVKAKNSAGYWSHEKCYEFTIRPPWWLTWWAYGMYAAVAIGSIIAYIRWRERAFRKRQKELEIKVDEATLEIRKQKEEVEEQKHLVEEKNREILDSIEYAKRIQTAILPPPRIVKEFLKNSFILYLPKDIVAGDFYWMESIDDTIYFAACDCTGHGVPGAMVSVVCNNALNRALNEFGERQPGKIFDRARELVLENFAKSDEEVKDGMDASLCALDINSKTLLWSGANNPLWVFRAADHCIEEIKADKQPIGRGYQIQAFTTHQVALQSGDILYLFTDGYADQFGGEKGKKLTKARFRDFLTSISHLSMEDQRVQLLAFHDAYRGSLEQVDDICVMGVRVL